MLWWYGTWNLTQSISFSQSPTLLLLSARSLQCIWTLKFLVNNKNSKLFCTQTVLIIFETTKKSCLVRPNTASTMIRVRGLKRRYSISVLHALSMYIWVERGYLNQFLFGWLLERHDKLHGRVISHVRVENVLDCLNFLWHVYLSWAAGGEEATNRQSITWTSHSWHHTDGAINCT